MIIPEDPSNRLLAEALYAAWAVAFTDGDPTKAVARIRDVLRGVERDAASVPTDAIELAVVWALITLDHEPSDDLLAWIRCAADAAAQRFGPGHRRTVRAKAALLGVLTWRCDAEAVADQRAALEHLVEHAGTPQTRTAALEVRAVAMHNAGHCQAGIDELVTLCQADINPPVRPRREYLYQLAAMLAACERRDEARILLDGVEPGAASTPGLIPTPIAEVAWTHPVRCERQPHNRPTSTCTDADGDFDWRTLL